MGKVTIIATWLKKFFDSLLFTLVKGALAATCAYFAFCISTESYALTLKEDLGNVGKWIIANGGLFIFWSAIVATIYQFIYAWADKTSFNWQDEYNKLNKKQLIAVTLLSKIDVVVAGKRQRFADLAKSLKEQPNIPSAKTIFKEITQPEAQIKIIIQSMYDCLEKIYPDDYIKLALMRVKNGALDDWQHYLPYNTKPRTTIADLKNECSTISHCLKDMKLKIISDTQLELKKLNPSDRLYIAGHTDPNERWSQLCYPVISINNHKVIFIISIAIRRENVFNASTQPFLLWLLETFESRLALEHSLKEIKELVN